MTTNNDRLDRIEALVEANSRTIDRNTANIATNTANITRLEQMVEASRQDIRQLAAIARTQQQTLQATATALIEEIRGLWAENRKILTHLFGELEG